MHMKGRRQHPCKSIRTKLRNMVLVLVMFSTLLIAIIAINFMMDQYRDFNETFKNAILKNYKQQLKFHVESIASLIDSYTQSVKNKKVSSSIEKNVRYIIHHASYDKQDGYFFVFNLKGTVIAHGADPALEGKNLIDLRGPTGVFVIQEIIAAAKNGTGFVTYEWTKPSDNKNVYKKLSYVTLIKNTPWFVGAGIYIDEVDQFVAKQRAKQAAALWGLILQFIIFSFSLMVFSIAVSIYFSARISQPIIYISRLAKRIAQGDYDARVEIVSNDELGDLASSFNLMAENIAKKIRELMEGEHYIRFLLESVADGLVVTDDDNEILQVNSAAVRIFEATERELLGSNITLWFPGNDKLNHHGEKIANYEITRIRKDGAECRLMVAVSSAVESGGMIRRVIYLIKDITEQYQLKTKVEQMNNLKKYFPTQIVEKLIEGDTRVTMAYDRKKVTIFFSDLAGFTDLSDSMEAEEVTAILRDYFTHMSNIVYKYSGTLDKFIGDAVMVFFGAPTSNGVQQDAVNCIKMALEMQEKLIELNKSWKLASTLKMRIGINTGYVTVGNFGSDIRLEYTIIGTPVNVASRLEHACPAGGVLISHDTAQYVKDYFVLAEQEPVQLKGIHHPVSVFQVVNEKK